MKNRLYSRKNEKHGPKYENLTPQKLASVPSAELLARLRDLVRLDRGLTAELLAHIGEVEARRLHLEAACPSMFRYCTDILGMSGAQSYRRIGAARLARRFSQVLPMVRSGEVHLSTLCLLAPHLTDDSADELLPLVAGKSKREVEQLLAARSPSPAVPDRVRKLPWRGHQLRAGRIEHEPKAGVRRPVRDDRSQRPIADALALPFTASPASEPPMPATDETGDDRADASEPSEPGPILTQPPRRRSIAPLSADQYRVELTASARLVDKIRTAQELMRHQVPDGDLATVLERAMDALLPALRKLRFAEVARPRLRRRAREAGHSMKRRSTRSETETVNRDLETGRNGARRDRVSNTGDSLTDAAPSAAERVITTRTDSAASRDSTAKPLSAPSSERNGNGRSRHIPAAVKRQVAQRDEYQCTFTDGAGRRCPERGLLEFHHIRPFGKGGRHDAENITLRCRGHNHLASIQEYGARATTFAKTTGHRAQGGLPPGGVPPPTAHHHIDRSVILDSSESSGA